MHAARIHLLLLAWLLTAAAVPAQENKGDRGGLAGKLRTNRSLMEALQPTEDDLSQRMTPVVRAVRATAPSVVSIYIKGGEVLSPFGRRRTDQVQGQGSGVILDPKGLVITNWHVVAAATQNHELRVEVRLKNGKQYPARVLSQSAEHDLALLQLRMGTKERVQPVVLGDSSSLMVGETVIAIGNPKGHANTVTVGVLSAENRNINVVTPDGQVRKYKGLLQTDAAINRGNSGGALLDITGKLIGINNAMAVDSENIGFAIPVNTVRKVFQTVLLASENLTSVFVGMTVDDRRGTPTVTRIEPFGPAARAGVQVGDRLVTAKGQAIRSKLDYARAVLDAQAAEPFSILVERAGRRLRLSPRPLSNSAWTVVRRVGLELEMVRYKDEPDLLKDATRAIVRDIYRDQTGQPRRFLPVVPRVTHVQPRSTGAALGIQKGDVILGLELPVRSFFRTSYEFRTFQSIDTLNDVLQSLSHRQRRPEVEIWILRKGKIMSGSLEIARF